MKKATLIASIVVLFMGIVLRPAISADEKAQNRDMDFVKKAFSGGLLEVKLGEYAITNAHSKDVKEFAKRMVGDHFKADKELLLALSKKGWKVSQELTKKDQESYDKMTKFKGAEFDKEYMRAMVEDHERDVAEFEDAGKYLQEPEILAWVKQTTPTLKEHLKLAKEVHGKVEKQ